MLTKKDLIDALREFRREFREKDLKEAFQEFRNKDLKEAFQEFRNGGLREEFKEFRKVIKKDINEAVDQSVVDMSVAFSKTLQDYPTREEVKEGFNNVQSSFTQMGQRIDKVENRLGTVETDVKDIKRAVNDLKADTPTPQEFGNHEKRISKLEDAVFASGS